MDRPVVEVVAMHGYDEDATELGERGEDSSEERPGERLVVGERGSAQPPVGVVEDEDGSEPDGLNCREHLVDHLEDLGRRTPN